MQTRYIDQIKAWRYGIRLYLGVAFGLVTIETAWWAQSAYGGTDLMAIRMQEVFAWLAMLLLAIALLVGPAYKLFPNLPARVMMRDARRLIGVGAAWFASLHAGIAYFVLFKAPNPFHLPSVYQRSFTVGVLALLILLALAFTSFDRAFRGLGIWWFRLHRLVYAAAILCLLHAFIVGVHATSWIALTIFTVTALLLVSMHTILYVVQPERPKLRNIVTLSFILLTLIAVFNYGYTQKLGYSPIKGKDGHQEE